MQTVSLQTKFKNKKMNKILLYIFLLFLNTSIFAQADQQQIYKFNQVLDAVAGSYADSVNEEKLTEDAIKSVLKDLDPHSLYFSKDEIEELNRGLIGSFVGVGISYDIIQDTVMILSVVKNGPSEKAGIKPGDRIITVENETIAGTGITDDKLRELLTGKKDTKVRISVKRRGLKKHFSTVITRAKIPVKSITAAYNINDHVSYIKLNRFSATTLDEFKAATDTLMTKKNAELILDLRYNSGGYLYAAVRLLENFFNKNTLVLYTDGVRQKRKDYFTHKTGKFRNNDLVVLINESSASAAEIVSGAVQDLDRGIVIGRRSYGKGLVQKPIYLVDGSMIRLTVAKYYTPSGRNIQKPYNKGIEDYNEDLMHRFEHGEYTNKDSIKLNDSLKFKTLNNNRLVYGGGGIMPDIFIPADTVHYPSFYRKQLNSGKINEFIHLYVEKNRNVIFQDFKNFENFFSDFELSDEEIENLINYVYEDEIKKKDYLNEFEHNKYIKTQLKALIANDIWDNTEYYKILNNEDQAVLKAVEVLNNKKEYAEILQSKYTEDTRN
ncbi:MAG: peptidase S41 [Bacteroidetes bacterium]|nr:MAG: peptidase S41 [Bacteroidota bacterium]